MDSSVSETYGEQQGSAFNGHFGCTCYHPLFVFNQFGDLERVMLRRGNHHSAKFWRRVLLPVIERYREHEHPQVLSGRRRVCLAEAVPASGSGELLVRDPPQGQRRAGARNRPPAEAARGSPLAKPMVLYHGFRYQAKSWDHSAAGRGQGRVASRASCSRGSVSS